MSLYRLTTNLCRRSGLVMKAALQTLLLVLLEYLCLVCLTVQ